MRCCAANSRQDYRAWRPWERVCEHREPGGALRFDRSGRPEHLLASEAPRGSSSLQGVSSLEAGDRRRSSARARKRLRSCSSASSRATRRISRAGRSSGRPAACSTRRWARRASIARGPTSRTRSSTSSGSRAGSGGSTRSRTPPSSPRAARGWMRSSRPCSPRVLVALGSTAAQSLLGRQFRVTKERGVPVESDLAPHVLATVHPSSILRAPDERGPRAGVRRLRGRPAKGR